MNRNPSEYIDEFLTFLREAESEYRMAGEQQDEANKETQDILHWIEFQKEEASAEISTRVQDVLHTIRQNRREAKDWEIITGPVAAWIIQNEPVRKKPGAAFRGSPKSREEYAEPALYEQNRHYG